VELTVDPIAIAFTGLRLVVTATGIAAGIALWAGRPAGPFIAKTYLALSSILVVTLVATGQGAQNVQPGLRTPLVAFALAQNAVWFAYLMRSRQVRERVQA
jgi:hypothetical protein